MQAVTFTQGQIHVLNMVSHIKTEKTLEIVESFTLPSSMPKWTNFGRPANVTNRNSKICETNI